MMSQQKALSWREGVKTATQDKPEEHDRCSLACVGEFSSLAQPVLVDVFLLSLFFVFLYAPFYLFFCLVV